MQFHPFPINNTAHGFAALLQSETIDIVVGPDHATETFSVPKALLVARSEHFAKALNDSCNFREVQDGKIRLPTENPVTITSIASKIFLFWLYHDSLPKAPDGKFVWTALTAQHAGLNGVTVGEHTDWLEGYIMMQYLNLPEGQNAIMRRLCDIVVKSANPLATTKAVKEIDTGIAIEQGEDQLRQFILDAVYYRIYNRPVGLRSLEQNFPGYANDDKFRLLYYKACADRVTGRSNTAMEELLKPGVGGKAGLLLVSVEQK